MKRWTFAAALMTVLTLKTSAAEFKSNTFEQASTLASGQAAPAVYDGSRSFPVLEQMGMNAAPNAAAKPMGAPTAETAIAAPARATFPRMLENVPMPQGMEAFSLPRTAFAPKNGAARDIAAPLGALIGLAAGFGAALGLSKVLA
jgi:hypothetical protein